GSKAPATKLWPADSWVARNAFPAGDEFSSVDKEMRSAAEKALRQGPAPVVTLSSAGQTDQSDPAFLATRRAVQDADGAIALAFASRRSTEPRFLDGACNFLLRWAATNRPTGQPIDETRIDGFLWAYDLIRGDLSGPDQETIETWLRNWRKAKASYSFGPITITNNHRVHHYKICLMLDKLLGDQQDFEKDVAGAKELLQV